MARVVQLLALLLCLASSLGAQATAGPGPGPDASVGVYELKLGDFSVKVTNWGARLMSVVLPDSKGNLADVVLGRDTVAEYFALWRWSNKFAKNGDRCNLVLGI